MNPIRKLLKIFKWNKKVLRRLSKTEITEEAIDEAAPLSIKYMTDKNFLIKLLTN